MTTKPKEPKKLIPPAGADAAWLWREQRAAKLVEAMARMAACLGKAGHDQPYLRRAIAAYAKEIVDLKIDDSPSFTWVKPAEQPFIWPYKPYCYPSTSTWYTDAILTVSTT